MSNEVKRMALLKIDSFNLLKLLQIPGEAEIIRIYPVNNFRGVFHIVVEGVGWDINPGEVIRETTGILTRSFDEKGAEIKQGIDWGFPDNSWKNRE